MFRTAAFVFAMAAATLAAGSALAQQAEELIGSERARAVSIDDVQGGDYLRSGRYTNRWDRVVYQFGTPAQTGGGWAASGVVVYDDVTFGNPCLPCGSTSIRINGMGIGFILPSTLPPSQGDHLYTRVSFYPNHDNGVPEGVAPYSGTPVVAEIDWGYGWGAGGSPGTVSYYTNPIPFSRTVALLTTSDVFDGGPEDRTAGVKIEVYHDAALTVRSNEFKPVRRTQHTSLLIGSSDTYGWFSNTPESIATGELTNSQRTGGGPLGGEPTRGTFMSFLMEEWTTRCSADFNRDGDFGTDADIEAFFACLAGNCCGSCDPRGADFNGDGDTGTDADIEGFFRVLAGGNC